MKNHMLLIVCLMIQTLVLNQSALALDGYLEIKGTTENYVIKNNDGLVDFSLIIPGMNYEQMINFDLGKVISPANDVLKVASYTVELPSNLSLPQQTEKYFISINLNKPEFRAYVDSEDIYNMYALYGKFPLNEMVKGFQNGKSIFELVEFFDFLSGGMKTVPVKGDVSGLTIPINQWNFTESYTVQAPTYTKDKVLISFSLLKENNQFYPTDMKKVLSGKTATLAKRPASEHWNLALLMNAAKRSFRSTYDGNILSGAFGSYSTDRAASPLAQVSYTMAPANATNSPVFLPTVTAPTFDKAAWTVKAGVPQVVPGVLAYATTLTLSEVASGGTENFPIDFKKSLWTTQTMGWVDSFQIPDDVKSLLQTGKQYSWDVAFVATTVPAKDSKIVWTKVSHVTRNSIKFK